MKTLYVYTNGIFAGTLTKQGVGYEFVYDAKYLDSPMPQISLNLPKRADGYRSVHLFPFFTNMLPEGNNRRQICRDLKIDESDLFGLLSAMADGDFIGAVEIKSALNA